MKSILLFFIAVTTYTNVFAQDSIIYKTVSSINDRDTSWEKAYKETLGIDTIYTLGSCMVSVSKEQNSLLHVEYMPEPGYDLYKYLSDSSIIPISKGSKNACRVPISFIVDITGSIKQARIGKSDCGKINESVALNLVEKMPKWRAGRQGGKPVPVRYTLPICFSRK